MRALERGQRETGGFDPGDVGLVGKVEAETLGVVHLRQQADLEQAGPLEQEVAAAAAIVLRMERLPRVPG